VEPKVSSACSQQPATCPNPQPDEPSPCPPNLLFSNTSAILSTQLSPWTKANSHSRITKSTDSPHAISLRSILILSSSYAQVSTKAPSLQVLQQYNLSSSLQVSSLLAQNCIMLVTVMQCAISVSLNTTNLLFIVLYMYNV
jgi:hypothetical protein